MSNGIATLKTVKAIRGERLVIDLGKTFVGTMESWMKKDPALQPYRSFEILSNRYLVLSQAKASDYRNASDVITESIIGTWFFDVHLIENVAFPENRKVVFSGTILFSTNITNSFGYESSPS